MAKRSAWVYVGKLLRAADQDEPDADDRMVRLIVSKYTIAIDIRILHLLWVDAWAIVMHTFMPAMPSCILVTPVPSFLE